MFAMVIELNVVIMLYNTNITQTPVSGHFRTIIYNLHILYKHTIKS